MSESRYGFSEGRHQATTVSMPTEAFPAGVIRPEVLYLPSFGGSRRPTGTPLSVGDVFGHEVPTRPRFMPPEFHSWSMVERIMVSTVEIIETRRSPNHPLRQDWTGELLIDGDKVSFSSDMKLEEGERYRVVLEHTEPVPGDKVLEIHQRINDERQHA